MVSSENCRWKTVKFNLGNVLVAYFDLYLFFLLSSLLVAYAIKILWLTKMLTLKQ